MDHETLFRKIKIYHEIKIQRSFMDICWPNYKLLYCLKEVKVDFSQK
jgi:hypothetical protein